jgi:hypothetical protein
MPTARFPRSRPAVALVGEIDHRDFAEASAVIGATSDLVRPAEAHKAEVIVLHQSRPGMIAASVVAELRRRAPLASLVSLVGSWCEGEPRTGRPHEGVRRVYWYDFPAWWQRQLGLRALGRCPDWAWPAERTNTVQQVRSDGVVALQTTCRETGDAIADTLRSCGYTTLWLPPNHRTASLPQIVAGIWEGRQLDDGEATQLADFSRRCAAPVVAILDFPRRHSRNRARQLGATTVLGKPWENASLVMTVQRVVGEFCGGSSARAA